MTNPRSNVILAGIGAALALLSACAPQVTVTPLGTGQVYPATPDSVPIPLYTVTKPECPFEEIAAITAEAQPYHTSDADVLAALKAKARALGAHAIIGYTQGTRVTATGSSTTDIPVRSGTAIRFRSEDCMK